MVDKKRLFIIANLVLPAFIEAHKKELRPDQTGVYMQILEHGERLTREVGEVIGTMSEDRAKEKTAFATKKLHALVLGHTGKANALSSFDVEDIGREIFGGAIFAIKYFLSVSGFPPHLDQKFAILIALTEGSLNLALAHQIDQNSYSKQEKYKITA